MVKVLINLISILLSVISSKLVYCYTAMVGFTVMLLNVIFPSFSKKYHSQSISLDHDELENLQKQISSSFTKPSQSCETFPVSADSSFNSHIALDVIESQNQRYQDYIKFKQQMKKKQSKTLSSTKESNQIDNQFLSAPKAYFNEISDAESPSAYPEVQDEQCFESAASANENGASSIYNAMFENQCSNICCYDKIACSIDNENLLEAASCATNAEDLECDAQGVKKSSIHVRNPLKNYTSYYLTNLNRKYNSKLNAKNNSKCVDAEESSFSQDFEEEDISTEDSSAANSEEDEEESNIQSLNEEIDHDDLQELSDFHQSQQMPYQKMGNLQKNNNNTLNVQGAFQPNMSNRNSSDYNIELLNQQVIKDQLHNYFNMNFLTIKKVKLDQHFNIHDQLENFCSRKRCPCLKFKRRFQRVRSVHSNKKKLPTILENFAY